MVIFQDSQKYLCHQKYWIEWFCFDGYDGYEGEEAVIFIDIRYQKIIAKRAPSDIFNRIEGGLRNLKKNLRDDFYFWKY